MTQDLRIEPGDDVLSITLARPDRRNAITVAMYAALADAIEAAARDDSVRVITIRGQGQDFTAGNDLMDFLA
jgi:enoyl-CoA hydratase/carnithine racemase